MRKFLFIVIMLICVVGLLLIFGDLFSGKQSIPAASTQLTVSTETLETAQKALDLVLKLDFDTLQTFYAESMKKDYSLEKSKKLWSDFYNTTGPYQSTLKTQNEKAGGNDKIIFTCRFQRRPAYIKITLNPSHEIEQLEASLNY